VNYRVLSRDPFARRSYIRKIADFTFRSRAFCGTARKAADRVQLFQYGTLEDDKAQPYFSKQAFCSASCARSYGVTR